MKLRLIIVLCIIITFSSCSRNKFQHSFEAERKFYYSEGSWLVNHIEVNLHAKAKKELTDLILEKLRKSGGNYIFFIENIKPDTLYPAPPVFNISKERLQQLESSVIHDYLINTRLKIHEDEGRVEVNIGIYNIESGERVYFQKTLKDIPYSGIFLSSKRLYRHMHNALSAAMKQFQRNAFHREEQS